MLRWIFAAALALGGCVTTVSPVPDASNAASGEPFSHALLDEVLRAHVDELGRVDYAELREDRETLDTYVGALAERSPDSHPSGFQGSDEVLAYWINAYNATVLQRVLDLYPIRSVRDRRPPWYLFFLPREAGFFLFERATLGGNPVSFYALENSVVRRRFPDPRIHFALNCASASCPRLPQRAFFGDTLNETLDREARLFVSEERNVQIDPREQRVRLSSIFKWYTKDFTEHQKTEGREPSLLAYIARYLDPDKAARLKACEDCEIEFIDYDWGLNDQPS